MTILEQIRTLFEKEQVSFRLETHQMIGRDSFEAARIRGSDVTKGAKALILEADEMVVQAIVPAHKKTKFSTIKKELQVKRVRLASPDTVLEKTGCVVGSVPPLGVLWNLPVFMEKTLLEKEEVVFSAGTLTESIYISPKELVRINKATLCDLEQD